MKATRTNANEYTVTNKDGASLKVSPHGTPGAFSPGELLQAALLGCASLSADMQLAHMLGKDFHAEAEVKSTEEDNHISEMLFDFLIDTEGRDEQEREKIIQAAAKKLSNCASSSARSIKVFPPTRISLRSKLTRKSPWAADI